MKTSNKILLGAFLVIILIITGVHLALYAKIKSRDFVPAKQATEESSNNYALPAIRYVSVTGLLNCYISPLDKPQLSVPKRNDSRISYRIMNDTLIIQGDSLTTLTEYEQGARNRQLVELYLPQDVQVKLAYGTIWLTGSKDTANAPSWSIELAKEAHLGVNMRPEPNTKLFLNRLDLVVNKSSAEFDNNSVINALTVRAKASLILCRNASIKKLSLNADSSSTITLSGANLKNFTTTP